MKKIKQFITSKLLKTFVAAGINLSLLFALSTTQAHGQGGPVVLMGIDAEDGGPNGHGPISTYISVVNSILGHVTNGGSGILVIGGGKSTTDNVTRFWNAIDAAIPAHSLTYVNGATAIAAQSFAGFAMIAVVSDQFNTPSGGLTNAENNELTPKQSAVAAFVNGGGGLLGFTSVGLTTPYGYIAGLGAFTFGGPFSQSNITPTAAGLAIGITNTMDICCWHDSYQTFPAFLSVLATYPGLSGNPAAAIGGGQVVIPGFVLTPPTATNPVGTTHTVTISVSQTVSGVTTPVSGVTVSFTVSGANTTSGSCVTGTSGQCSFTYLGTNAGTDNITVTAIVAGQVQTATASVNFNTSCVAATITCPAPAPVSNDAGQCGAIVNYGEATVTGTPVPTVTYSIASGSFFPVGTTSVTAFASNACSNVSCTFDVVVNDVEPPTAICKNATITLVNGVATIIADDVNNGSFDNCGAVTLSVSKTSFNCSNIGDNTITLTVTDGAGNSSTCTATVTVVGVIPTCSIVSVPSNNVYTGGNPNHIYLGYGPQSTTLQVTASGGGPFTYSWSGPAGLSNYNTANPVFTPTVGGTYNFTVLVTNSSGCTTTCTITICVLDIRVFKQGVNTGKVYLCHTPPGNPLNMHVIQISVSGVPAHLTNQGGNHVGCKLGKCTDVICGSSVISWNPNVVIESVIPVDGFQLVVSPNPTSGYFTVKVKGNSAEPVSIRIMNMAGQSVEKVNKVLPSSVIRIGDKWIEGNYLLEAIQGNEKKVVQLIKLK